MKIPKISTPIKSSQLQHCVHHTNHKIWDHQSLTEKYPTRRLRDKNIFLLGKENAWPLSLCLRSSLLAVKSGKGMYTLFTWFRVSYYSEKDTSECIDQVVTKKSN